MISCWGGAAGAVESSDMAASILRDAGIKRGICVVVGGDGLIQVHAATQAETFGKFIETNVRQRLQIGCHGCAD